MPNKIDSAIECRGIRVHNLKNIDVSIPQGRWTTFCGVSGSGKTSLAFDTLYAEGQRRFISSFSVYARQFLDQIQKPDADSFSNLLPAIAIKAESGKAAAGTTVGSSTETLDYLRILFAEAATPVCENCGSTGVRATPDTICREVSDFESDRRMMIAFPVEESTTRKPSTIAADYRELGFSRAVIGEQIVSLDDLISNDSIPTDSPNGESERQLLAIVVDRLVTGSLDEGRLADSLETAFRFGNGVCLLLIEDQKDALESPSGRVELAGKTFSILRRTRFLGCGNCDHAFAEPTPNLFNYNSSAGRCENCKGDGQLAAKSKKQPKTICDICNGQRLTAAAYEFQFDRKNIVAFCDQSIEEIRMLFESDQVSLKPSLDFATKQLQNRLTFLCHAGLGYLTLNRPVETLSHGERQRIRLTTALASDLVNTLYVLDEPTRGLHPENVGRLSESLRNLVDRGNTLIVVDHEPMMIRSADHVLELGPEAGETGGHLEFSGTPVELAKCDDSPTGQFFSGKRGLVKTDVRDAKRKRIHLSGVSGNNLKQLNVSFPTQLFCVVTGVSGAGKSSLVADTLYPAIANHLLDEQLKGLPFDSISGYESFDEVILIDESPIGRSSRSNPVTYVKAFDEIRRLFAATSEAQALNLTAGHFSFNVDAGRCTHCKGDGFHVVDMQFMADLKLVCEVCNGQRFRDEVLSVKYRGKNMIEVLALSVREAFTFFRGQSKIQSQLNPLLEVGLGYLRLGQPASTLSTGESQRLKMAFYLGAAKSRRTLFIMDEPAAGLHMKDILKLLDCFDSLLAIGHSIIAVEHHLQMIANADWVIDLGPGAGNQGGAIVAEGPPRTIASNPDSVTGKHLSKLLEEFGHESES